MLKYTEIRHFIDILKRSCLRFVKSFNACRMHFLERKPNVDVFYTGISEKAPKSLLFSRKFRILNKSPFSLFAPYLTPW